MYQYSRPHITPRSGYTYTDPDTGTRFEEPVHRKLVQTVMRHRRANNLPIHPKISAIIEDDICQRNPPSFRKSCPVLGSSSPSSPGSPTDPGQARLSFSVCVNRTLKILKTNFIPKPDNVVIAQRAEICLSCRHNIPEPGCYGCHAEEIFNGVIGKHKSMKTQFVCLCSVDQTFSKATTHVNSVYEDNKYPEHCWKRG